MVLREAAGDQSVLHLPTGSPLILLPFRFSFLMVFTLNNKNVGISWRHPAQPSPSADLRLREGSICSRAASGMKSR